MSAAVPTPDQLDIRIRRTTQAGIPRIVARWSWEHTDRAGDLHSSNGEIELRNHLDPISTATDIGQAVARQMREGGVVS